MNNDLERFHDRSNVFVMGAMRVNPGQTTDILGLLGELLNGNYIVDHGKSLKNHGMVFLNFCGNPGRRIS